LQDELKAQKKKFDEVQTLLKKIQSKTEELSALEGMFMKFS